MGASNAKFYLRAAVALALPAIGFAYFTLGDTLSTEASSQAKCPLVHATQIYESISELPASIDRDLRQRVSIGAFPGIADSDRPFNITDVVRSGLPTRRFVRAGSWDRYVFVWYEHGGLGYHIHVALYERQAESGTFEAAGNFFIRDATRLCPATDALLDGKNSSALLASDDHW